MTDKKFRNDGLLFISRSKFQFRIIPIDEIGSFEQITYSDEHAPNEFDNANYKEFDSISKIIKDYDFREPEIRDDFRITKLNNSI